MKIEEPEPLDEDVDATQAVVIPLWLTFALLVVGGVLLLFVKR